MALTSKIAKAITKAKPKEDLIRKSNKDLQTMKANAKEGSAQAKAVDKEMARRQYRKDDRIDTYNKERDDFDYYAYDDEGEYVPNKDRKYKKGEKQAIDKEFSSVWKKMREEEIAAKKAAKGKPAMAKGGVVKKAPVKKPAVKKPVKKGK
jgi:hypothetical protein